MDYLISRQAALNCFHAWVDEHGDVHSADEMPEYRAVEALPSAQPEISRIEQELHDKTPEEQYEFLYWLLSKFGRAYTDSRLAVVEWLRGEKDDK